MVADIDKFNGMFGDETKDNYVFVGNIKRPNILVFTMQFVRFESRIKTIFSKYFLSL